jgi:hypothetical protein
MAFMKLRSFASYVCALALVAVLASLVPALAAPTFPALTGRVVDDADLLSPEDEQALTQELKELEDKSSDQLVVVTLPSLQGYTIEDFGYQLGRHWGIGTAELDNGVLLARTHPHRRALEDHHRERHPAALPHRRFSRRHQGRRARHRLGADRRRGGAGGARQGAARRR